MEPTTPTLGALVRAAREAAGLTRQVAARRWADASPAYYDDGESPDACQREDDLDALEDATLDLENFDGSDIEALADALEIDAAARATWLAMLPPIPGPVVAHVVTTAEQLDGIEPTRENLSETYAAIRRLVERTLFTDPQSSAAIVARMVLDGLSGLRARARTAEQSLADLVARRGT